MAGDGRNMVASHVQEIDNKIEMEKDTYTNT